MNLIAISIFGMVLGVSIAAPPGPVISIMVDRASRSVKAGTLVGMGAMTADIILMFIVIVFRDVINLQPYDAYIYLLGGSFFVLLSIMILHSKNEEFSAKSDGSGYFLGLSTGLVNPMQIGWWLTAGIGIFQKFSYTPFYFFWIGIVAWVIFLSVMVNRSVIKFGDRVRRVITYFSFATLIVFGLLFIYLGISEFITI